MPSDLYSTEGDDFTDALFEFFDELQAKRDELMLDENFYEHSAE